ncbi:MAG: hypothetical protein ACI8PG_005130, partial [Planctomycetota bacterium]
MTAQAAAKVVFENSLEVAAGTRPVERIGLDRV